ncbi:MAG: hypothetical protein J6O61_13040 [Butyrivibrio sp.]|uniref:hypothetical protein n=1 Tax=Butyrivibrio sp. TaxID=28121 RepID=UPI001B0BE1B5|nr:hypothetical protein [Butyrivibrio sp.]MBO6241745.1 hypothetical protein [Butyrivibrio sp.]
MKSEADIVKRLNDEIDSYLTCPKFTVEEHAHNVTMLAWVLDISDEHLSEMIKVSEASFGGSVTDSSDYYDED